MKTKRFSSDPIVFYVTNLMSTFVLVGSYCRRMSSLTSALEIGIWPIPRKGSRIVINALLLGQHIHNEDEI